MTDDDLTKLQQRVANGLEWLNEHDPLGRFHLWYVARISPSGPFPAQEGDPDTVAAYRDYCDRRRLWERLSSELERHDPDWRDASEAPGIAQWQGNPAYIQS